MVIEKVFSISKVEGCVPRQGEVWKTKEVEDREEIKGWDEEAAETEGWIF